MIQIMLESLFSDALRGIRRARFDANQHVFLRGKPVTHIYFVHSGRVSLMRDLKDGIRVSVGSAGAGESFAEAALYADKYHCDAVCLEESEISSAPVREVRRVLARHPDIAARYGEHLAGQIRDLRSRLELRNIKRAPDRLLAWLHLKAKGNCYTPSTSWAEIATELGLTPEAVYRALSVLERTRRLSRLENRKVMLRT